jgi:hypothetical protein
MLVTIYLFSKMHYEKCLVQSASVLYWLAEAEAREKEEKPEIVVYR